MKMVILAATAGFLLSPNFASAEEVDGIVQSVSLPERTLSLQSGQTFTFENVSALYGIVPGQRIGVSFSGTKGIAAFDPHPADQADIDVD